MTRWIAAGGAFVVSLDSMVNVAFPAMGAAFAAPPEQLRWVIVSYVLFYAVMSLAGGMLGDAVGYTRVLRLGLAGSVLAFAAAGLAPTFGWLLAARALQGVGAGLIYGTTPALVTQGLADHQRARALGFLNAAISLASSVAPTLAGWLVGRFGWPAIFLVRAPLALSVLAWVVTRAEPATARVASPAMAVRDVVRAGVIVPGILSFLANGGIFAIWLLAPFYLVERRGLSTLVAGALFSLAPLGMTAGAALAGRLPGILAGRGAVTAGLVLEAGGLLALSTAGPATSVGLLAVALFVTGLGLGLFQVPNMAALMREFPAGRQGAAGGVAFLARTLGVVAGVLGLARLFADLRASVGFDAGFARAYAAAALVVGAAALLGAVRRPRPSPPRR